MATPPTSPQVRVTRRLMRALTQCSLHPLHPLTRLAALLLPALLVGGALRGIGLGFGLPHEFHPDEFRVLDVAIGLAKSSLGEIRFWNYPPALANICAGVYRAFDMVHAPRAELLLAGRIVVFVLGIVTVLAVAAAAYSASGLRAAILGGALAAVSPLMIEHCRYLTPDTPTAAGTALVALAAAQITRHSSRRGWRYAFAGVAVGLAASFKYVGALSAITIIAAHVFSSNRRDWRAWVLLLAAGVLSVLTFVALNHQVIASPHWMTAALQDEFRHYTHTGGGYATSFAAPHVLLYVASCGTGWVGAAFLMCALLGRRSPVVCALLVGAGGWLVFVATRNVFFARNLVHLLPLLFVLVGVVGSELPNGLRIDTCNARRRWRVAWLFSCFQSSKAVVLR
jgi:4-amino-4-deoxy-L-arabinose transferase-like glycosyltransferase